MTTTDLTSKAAVEKLLGTIRADQEANGVRLEAIEKQAKDLGEALRNQSAQAAHANRAVIPGGTEREVEREYCLPDGYAQKSEVADLRDDGRLLYGSGDRTGRCFVGSGGSGKVVRMIGSEEIGGLYEFGLLDDPNPVSPWQKRLQELCEARTYARAIKTRGGRPGATPRIDRAILRHLRRGPPAIAKVFADNPGEGAEWIPDVVTPMLQRELELARQLEGVFRRMTLTTGGVTTSPFLSTGVQPFIHGVPAPGDLNPGDLEKSVPVTADSTVSPTTLTVSLPTDRDAAEDSIVAFSAQARSLLVEALRDGKEDAIVNGDLGVHQDAIATWNPRNRWETLGSSGDHRKGWIGLRARSFDVGSAFDGAATEGIAGAIGWLGQLAVPHAFDDVIYATSPEHLIAVLLTDPNILTVDKAGPNATILTGQVGFVGGKPLMLSEFITADLNVAGLFDKLTNQPNRNLIIKRARFWMMDRRGVQIDVETVARQHTTYFVASERTTLHTFDQPTRKNVAFAYNLTPSTIP